MFIPLFFFRGFYFFVLKMASQIKRTYSFISKNHLPNFSWWCQRVCNFDLSFWQFCGKMTCLIPTVSPQWITFLLFWKYGKGSRFLLLQNRHVLSRKNYQDDRRADVWCRSEIIKLWVSVWHGRSHINHYNVPVHECLLGYGHLVPTWRAISWLAGA